MSGMASGAKAGKHLLDEVEENRQLHRWAQWLPRPVASVGAIHESDAELVVLRDGSVLACTVDTIVEEIRMGLYRDGYTAGWVAVTAALSDLAAVGADPLGILLSVTLPRQNPAETQERVAMGVRDACIAQGTWVLGGDTNHDERLSITCAALGTLPQHNPVRRIGMRSGDRIFLSGPVGVGSALAAARFLSLPSEVFDEHAYRPVARLAEGCALRNVASSAMDTSDGLVATLDQLARLNHVAIRVEPPLDSLLDSRADAVRRALRLPSFPFVASPHGEFELVFAVPAHRVNALHEHAAAIGWTPLRVGCVQEGAGLWFGAHAVDGAWVRNLWTETRGNPQTYLRALCSAGLP